MRTSWIRAALVLAASACAPVPPPTGPTRAALPPSGKGGDHFDREDLECRAMAADHLHLGPVQGDALVARLRERQVAPVDGNLRAAPWARLTLQQRYDAVYLRCSSALGNGF